MKTKRPILALAAVGILLASGLSATTLMKMSTGEMTLDADTIVIGTCVSAETARVGGRLVTLIEVSVDETLKGTAASGLTMIVPGGIDHDRPVPVAVTVPGAPTVFPNENVLLFLGHSAAVVGAYDVVGFSQGVYEVVEDTTGNKLAAQGRFNGSNGASLNELKAEIQQALGQ